MIKKVFGRIIPMVLVLCMVLSMTTFAATTYYIEVSISGPDANGVDQTVTGVSSKYGSLQSPLAYEVVQVLNAELGTIEKVFAKTGLRQIVYDGLTAYSNGASAWDAYAGIYDDDVTGDFKTTLRSLDSKFEDLGVNKTYGISYVTDKKTRYIVTVTLRKNQIGSADGECLGDENCTLRYYDDIDVQAWYHKAIHFVVENDLMVGYSNGLFGPNDTLTRAQVAQIMYSLEDNPEMDATKVFGDVATSAWYAKAVTWAYNAGIIAGVGNGNFKPEDPVTREQMAAIFYRYSQYKGYDVSSGESVDLSAFKDAKSVSSWAVSAVKWAFAEEIIVGKGNGLLDPTGFATRAEAASIFMRYCQNVAA